MMTSRERHIDAILRAARCRHSLVGIGATDNVPYAKFRVAGGYVTLTSLADTDDEAAMEIALHARQLGLIAEDA